MGSGCGCRTQAASASARCEEAEVFEAMWKAGGATEEEPMPYLKTILCRVVSIAAV
jgi:hypothetical protein